MKDVRNLVAKGETKQALTHLQTLVEGDNEDRVIALLARFNAHQNEVNKGKQDLDNQIINQNILIFKKQ